MTVMAYDTGGLEILAAHDCLSLLRRALIGRIVFTDNALPAIQPVGYTLDGGDVVIRTSARSRLAAAVRDAVVAFEVDDFDSATGHGWSVVVTGQARAVTDQGDLAELRRLPLQSWVPGTCDHYIRIRPAVVSGRRRYAGG